MLYFTRRFISNFEVFYARRTLISGKELAKASFLHFYMKTDKKPPCAACGTSPVNHRLMFVTEVIDGIFDKTVGLLFGWMHIPREGRLANAVTRGFVGTFWFFGLARFDTDIEKAASGRSKLIWEEAARRGIRMQQIVMFGKHLEQYRAKIDGRWIYFQSIPIPHFLPQGGYDWIDDKFRLTEKLSAAGIAAPKTSRVSSWSSAKRALVHLHSPLIVKPRSGSRGRHTTTNIKTETELRAAYRLAKMIAPALVVEEHLFGSVYRATVIDGKLVGFFRADPPQVIGNGTLTVRALIEKKNAERNEKLSEISINDDLISFLARSGYTLESALPAGSALDLSAKTGRMYGGYTREMLPEVHKNMHEIFARAGAAVDAGIVGFDLIIPDPKADPDTQRWGIIEANSLPFIDLHYFALEGTPINLAKNIWDLWDEKMTIDSNSRK